MAWIQQRVWQLGIAVIVALIGTVLMYLGGTEPVNTALLWVGLILVWLALLVPLVNKAFGGTEDEEED